MRKINWLAILPSLLFVGLGYFLYMPVFSAEKIDHFMLVTSGISLGLLSAGWMAASLWNLSSLHRERRWWKTILSILGVVAGVWSFMGAIFGTVSAGLISTAPDLDVYNRFRLIHITSLPATAYWVFLLVAVWNRFKVAEDTIVVLDGKILYPGTRFTLWPWFRYRVRKLDRWFKIPPTKLELDFTDVRYKVRVQPRAYLAISVAQEDGVEMLEPKGFIQEVREWVTEQIREQARTQTLGEFLLGEFLETFFEEAHERVPSEWTKIRGICVAWDRGANVTLVH